MAGLNLNIADEMWCVWLKGVYASDYQQTEQTLLAILGWLAQPRIQNLMRYAPLRPFPYHKNIVNSWFSLPPNGELQRQAVKVINVDENGKLDKCYTTQYDQAFPGSLSDEEYEVFFHGTRHTSAKHIIDNNIDLANGKPERDFSSGDGFYLCKDFDEALSTRWAKNRPPGSAVLVFRVRRAELRGAGRNGLDLRDDRQRWQELVSLFRSADDKKSRRDRSNERAALRDIRWCDFIEGPIASENQNFDKPSTLTPIDGSYQLCIRSDTCAELYNQSLHSVVFFHENG